MPNREKVKKGLECLARKQKPTANPCKGCGYNDRVNFAFCVVEIASDTLELLEEQEKTIETQRDIIRVQEEQIADLQEEILS